MRLYIIFYDQKLPEGLVNNTLEKTETFPTEVKRERKLCKSGDSWMKASTVAAVESCQNVRSLTIVLPGVALCTGRKNTFHTQSFQGAMVFEPHFANIAQVLDKSWIETQPQWACRRQQVLLRPNTPRNLRVRSWTDIWVWETTSVGSNQARVWAEVSRAALMAPPRRRVFLGWSSTLLCFNTFEAMILVKWEMRKFI